jgi:hypothetical protein
MRDSLPGGCGRVIERVLVPGRGVFAARPGVGAGAIASLLESHRLEADPARVLKRNRGTVVTRVSSSLPGAPGEWVVKETPIPWRRRLYHRAGGTSRFAGEFERVEKLAALGIEAPRPLAASSRPAGRSEFLITELISGARPLRDLLWMGPEPLDDPGLRRRLLEGVGAWLRGLHEAGVWQRDMKAGNVLATHPKEGPERFVLIDIDGVRILRGPLGESRRVRNLAQILDLPRRLDEEAATGLLAGYAGGDASLRERLGSLASLALEARRRERQGRTGARHVDEEVADA